LPAPDGPTSATIARPQGEIDAVQHLELGSGEPEDAAHIA